MQYTLIKFSANKIIKPIEERYIYNVTTKYDKPRLLVLSRCCQ